MKPPGRCAAIDPPISPSTTMSGTMTKPATPSLRCIATFPAPTSEACVNSSASQSVKTVP